MKPLDPAPLSDGDEDKTCACVCTCECPSDTSQGTMYQGDVFTDRLGMKATSLYPFC